MFRRIKEKLEFEKTVLNGIRYRFNNIYTPIFWALNVLIYLVCFVLCAKVKNPIFIILALVLVSIVLTVCYLIYGKKLKNKEVIIETEKLKTFFGSKLIDNPDCNYELAVGGGEESVTVKFKEDSIQVGDLVYSKNGFDCSLYTSNFMYQVSLILLFTRNSVGDEDDGDKNGVTSFSLPLNLNMLSILYKFGIDLKNPDVLKFIKDNPRIAAEQILKYGKVQDDYKKLKEQTKK